MEQAELLRVEDSFLIKGKGLVLLPDFPIPEAGWKDCQHVVRVETPDGFAQEMTAHMNVTHFNTSAPNATVNERWRITVRLKEAEEKLPVGSLLYAPREVCDVLFGN